MATDPNQQNVRISEIDSSIPKWASDETAEKILNAIKNGDSNLFKAASSQVNMTGNMTLLLGKLVALIGGDKDAAKNFKDTIKKMQSEQAILRRELASLDTGIKTVADNTNPSNIPPDPEKKKSNKLSEAQLDQIKSLNFFERIKSRMDLQGLKTEKEQLRALHGMIDGIDLTNAQLKENMSEIIKKLGLSSNVVDGNDPLGGVMAFLGKGNMLQNAMDTATALYGASQVPFEMMMQQVKDRFEITTELRQSGLLENMSASFVDVTKSFSDNKMTIVEATQFVREFSKSVGVMGTTAALEFVDKMAYANDMMGRFGLSFSQVAKISGMYLDTLERTGMLEQISSSERDRGMKSFMSAVEGVSMTLKTSLEESAKMMRDYLSRDDVSAMLATTGDQLSQEVVTQISAMANMGPLGEIIAMGAIDPNRFALTPQYGQLNQPGLSGVRGIIDAMMVELRSGRGTDEIIAQYSQQLSDMITRDPVVATLVTNDPELQKIVSGIRQMAMTAQDAVNEIAVPAVDQEERRRQDAERRRASTIENLYAASLKSLEASGELEKILMDQTKIIETQISAVNSMADSANLIANLLELSADTNMLVMQSTADLAKYVADLLPKDQEAKGTIKEVGDTLSDVSSRYDDEMQNVANRIREESGKDVLDRLESETSSGTFESEESWLQRALDIKSGETPLLDDSGNQITIDDNMKSYLDSLISKIQTEITADKMSWTTSIRYINEHGNIASKSDIYSSIDSRLEEQGTSLEELNALISDPTRSVGDKDEAKQNIYSAANDEFARRMSDITSLLSDDGEIWESELEVLKRYVSNFQAGSDMTDQQILQMIEALKSNDDFKTLAGQNMDTIISALQSPVTPTEQTEPIKLFADSDFATALATTNVDLRNDATKEVYTQIYEVVGDSNITATEKQIEELVTTIASSRNLSPEDLKVFMEEMVSTLNNNFDKISTATGENDTKVLIAKMNELISSLG